MSAPDRSTAQAFTRATYGRAGRPLTLPRRPGLVCAAHGRAVYRSSRTWPYGRSTHQRARLVHRVDAIYTAWASGHLVGSLVRWTCGATTTRYQLLETCAGQACAACDALPARPADALPQPPGADTGRHLLLRPPRGRAC
ncbi:hypothetical protein ACFFMN_23595 [Planobispora siamensis]|uniref:Uncharacterized protein n=1 Tax=Planobispora siamensis TaxID=936338 RepID=A0A8J3SN37_9ACTN|nr:hypothetical protein [Planobispora siamensis]GIH95349.1 hypothetical protein Psi01_59790 [Planobispora siamensis]